jgi:hypothetical protein
MWGVMYQRPPREDREREGKGEKWRERKPSAREKDREEAERE